MKWLIINHLNVKSVKVKNYLLVFVNHYSLLPFTIDNQSMNQYRTISLTVFQVMSQSIMHRTPSFPFRTSA